MLLQAAGHFFVFKILQQKIRQDVKQQIRAGAPEAELILFKIFKGKPRPAFQQLEEQELRYNEKMFDIVRQENHGDTTWYYCLADDKETQLFADLDELVKRDMSCNPEQRQRLERLLTLFVLLFFCPHSEDSIADAVEEMLSNNYCFSLKSWIDMPLTPPPEV